MPSEIEAIIREIITETQGASLDAHGFLNHVESAPFVRLVIAFDAYCRKHGRPRMRG